MREITYRKRQKRRNKFLGWVCVFLILIALVIFGLFRVREMTVLGNSIYTATDIQNAVLQDGLCKNSLYLFWKYKDDSRLKEELPFLSSIEVKLLSPFRVEVRVYEKPVIGYFLNGRDYVYFDQDGLIVEISKKLRKNIPEITGITISKPERYAVLSIKEESLFDLTIELAQILNKNEVVPKKIKFDDSKNITLYFDKARVKLGDGEQLEEKVVAFKSVYDKVSTMEGILHMETFTEDAKTITFKQGETEASLELEGESEGKEGENEPSTENQEETETEAEKLDVKGSFSTDAQGNKIYTDPAGNITPRIESYNYTDENGKIITDGYGYIDPYTGAYILGQ